MKIALLQYDIKKNPHKSLDKIESLIGSIKGSSVDLAVLPEMCLTGYPADPTKAFNTEDDEYIKRLISIASEANCVFVGSFCIKGEDTFYNRALWIGPEGIVGKYDKQKLFTPWNEDKYFTPGEKPYIHSFGKWKVSCFICYDLRFPEVFSALEGKAQVIAVVSNWPESRRHHWTALLKERAIENQTFVVGVNRVGNMHQMHFSGDSLVFNPQGEVILDLKDQEICSMIELNTSY